MLSRIRNLQLRWKVLLAPVFLILVFVGLGAQSIHMLRSSRASTQGLMAGPVYHAEIVADFSTAIWAAQARLYHLTATAANETDRKKIAAVAAEVSGSLKEVTERLDALTSSPNWDRKTADNIDKLKAATARYLKQARTVIDMADGEAGAALMFMMTAQRDFTEIDKLTDDITDTSKEVRDLEIARADQRLDRQVLLLTAIGIAAIVIGCLVSLMVSRGIARPVVVIAKVIDRIAHGNLNIAVPSVRQKDEVGMIVEAVHVFKQNMLETEQLRADQLQAAERAEAQKKAAIHRLAQDFQAAASDVVEKVAASAAELEETARTLMETARATKQLANTVETTSTEAANNVHSVASAAEQINGAAHRIASEVEASSQFAGKAVSQAEQTDANVAALSHAATHIGNVVKVIGEIADQTNLLALNATIEAARSGEAGRGFAVVAHEVKALASQTAAATADIHAQVTGIQSETASSVSAIKDIGGTIRKISEIATVIAARVAEQGSATEEIARNVVDAAKGVAQVASSINELTRASSRTETASAQLLNSAQVLTHESGRLKLTVEEFLARVRAA